MTSSSEASGPPGAARAVASQSTRLFVRQTGTDPERLLHDMTQRLQPSSQRERPLMAREIAEKQYHEGKISHVPTRQPLTPEEREAREPGARRFAGGKPAAEMVIEDRGPY